MSDIVKRLRESDGGFFMRKMFKEAADEIERLVSELDAARADANGPKAPGYTPVYGLASAMMAITRRSDKPADQESEIAEMLAQCIRDRDDARRKYCMCVAARMPSPPTNSARWWATKYGWDCYGQKGADEIAT